MLSLTSEYALRALIYLAQHETDWPISASKVAKGTEIPPKYLSKILGDLVRDGVLEASRGKGGGFRMAHPPQKTSLLEVLEPFERFGRRRCPFQNKQCSDENPCGAHEQWKRVLESYQRFLRRTSIHSVVTKKQGRARRSRKR